jgi:protein TonB
MKRGESFIDAAANYEIVIQLERHKNYPAAVQAHHETGVATVAFSIDRESKVVATHVVRSSGFASLDQETIATVHRAAPFPPPPANLLGPRFDFTVPIQFNIR